MVRTTVFVLLCWGLAQAWWGQTHNTLAKAAVVVLPSELPSFFREAVVGIAHVAVDPDVSKNRMAPASRESEGPEHYFDFEMMQGRELPRARFEFVKLCCDIGVRPEKVGMLPYGLAEWTERLAVAFAEYRKWPKNATVRQKCIVYAGPLAHYAADLCQPLHVTLDYDGRARPDGSSPKSGIHEKVDGLVEALALKPAAIASGVRPATVDSVFAFGFSEMAASRGLLDTLYALEGQLPGELNAKVPPAVVAFGTERARRAAAVIAGYYVAAWRLSERIPMEDWLDRDAQDKPPAK